MVSDNSLPVGKQDFPRSVNIRCQTILNNADIGGEDRVLIGFSHWFYSLSAIQRKGHEIEERTRVSAFPPS